MIISILAIYNSLNDENKEIYNKEIALIFLPEYLAVYPNDTRLYNAIHNDCFVTYWDADNAIYENDLLTNSTDIKEEQDKYYWLSIYASFAAECASGASEEGHVTYDDSSPGGACLIACLKEYPENAIKQKIRTIGLNLFFNQ